MEIRDKKIILKVAMTLLALIAIISISLFAWAKYRSTKGGDAEAQVAKWHFDLKNVNGQSATVENINFPMTRLDGNTSVASEKIAPGTSGEFKMIIDTRGTDVLMMYNIKIELTDCPTNLNFFVDSAKKQKLEKVEIGRREENGTTIKTHQLSISKFLPLNEVNKEHTETIYWEWPMETGITEEDNYKNNLEDSLWANKGTMDMKISATGRQVLEDPSQIAITSINVENTSGSTSTVAINKQNAELSDAINANIILGLDNNSASTMNVSITNLSNEIYYYYQPKLLSVTGGEISSSSIEYEITGLSESRDTTIGTKLIPSSTKNFTVTFKYKDGVVPSSSNNTLNAVLKFEFKKAYSITYAEFEDDSNYPKVIIEGGTININMPTKIAKVKVTTNNALMIQNDGYTYNNNTLIIQNVNGNIEIEDTGLRQFEGVNDGIVSFATRETSTENNFGDFNIIYNKNTSSISQNFSYHDNNGKLEYNEDNSLKLDEDNAIASVNISSANLSDEYSMYITVKADTNQTGLYEEWGSMHLPGTIIAISETSEKYLFWLGFYKDYINLYSYYDGPAKGIMDYNYEQAGFISFNASEYSNKIFNIQITATRDGNTKVYINGVLEKEFSSGQGNISYKSIIIGDLRPGRGVKFIGNIYDVAFYNRALTKDEVDRNWEHAQSTWNIE